MSEITNSNIFVPVDGDYTAENWGMQKFVDLKGLDYFWEKARKYVDDADAAELAAREAAIAALDATVAALDATVAANKTAIETALADEANLRAQEDLRLQTMIEGEASVRESEMADLKDNAYAYTDALRAEYEVTKGRIDTFLDSEEVAGTIDTLHEINKWMTESGADATNLSKAIADEKTAREADVARLEASIAGEAAQREGEIADLKDNAYAYTDAAKAEAIADADAKFAELRQYVDTADAAEKTAREADVARLEAAIAGEASVRESEMADLKDNAYAYSDAKYADATNYTDQLFLSVKFAENADIDKMFA